MRVLVVGASGAIGTRLVPRLRQRGHEVIGSSRSPGTAGRLRELGCEPIALDALDAAAVRGAVAATRPDAIIYQATALANGGLSRNLDRGFAQTNRLRTDGTDILLAAARQAGVRRFVAQSFAPYRYAREGGPVKTEDDPLWLARLAVGKGVVMMTESRGASNAKAKKELGWTLRYPSWRQGFTAAYSQPQPARAAA